MPTEHDQDHRRIVRGRSTEGERLGGPTTAVMLAAIDAFADDLGPDPTLVRQILIAWETQGRPS